MILSRSKPEHPYLLAQDAADPIEAVSEAATRRKAESTPAHVTCHIIVTVQLVMLQLNLTARQRYGASTYAVGKKDTTELI